MSSFVETLLVECLCRQISQSSRVMPVPLSDTTILSMPPPSIEMSIISVPASREFSMSSLTIEDGFSITSPADMSETRSSLKTLILLTGTPHIPNDECSTIPPTTVISTSISMILSVGTSRMFSERTTKSALFPTLRLPRVCS